MYKFGFIMEYLGDICPGAFSFHGEKSCEKSGVIVIGLPLCYLAFSLTAFTILSLFRTFDVLIIIWEYVFLFYLVCLEFCMLLVFSWASLFLG